MLVKLSGLLFHSLLVFCTEEPVCFQQWQYDFMSSSIVGTELENEVQPRVV